MKSRTIEVLIDAGSSAVRVAIVQIGGDDGIEMLGVGCVKSNGIRRGVIVDMDKLSDALSYAIEDAERGAGLKINSAWYTLSSDILALNSDAFCALRQRDVSEDDIEQVRSDAINRAHDTRYRLLHALPQHYIVDEHEGIIQPRGMIADRLGVRMHVIQVLEYNARNLERCSEQVNIGCDGFVFSGLAASEAILTEDERQLGCCAVDIGAGSLDFVAWAKGQAVFSGSIPVGGEYASSDLAQLLRTPRDYAENLKCTKGSLSNADDEGEVVIPNTTMYGQKTFPREQVNEILRQRYHEILQLLVKELHRGGCLRQMNAGLVLTGGAARMRGLEVFAHETTGLNVRVTRPLPVLGLAGHDDEHCFAGIIGMAARLADPKDDGAWVSPPKQGIIKKLKTFFSNIRSA